MKLINFIIKSMFGFSILISFASCDDFLDRDPSDRITEEEVFQKIQTAEEYLNNAYTFLPDFQTCTEDLGGRYKLGGGTDEIGYQIIITHKNISTSDTSIKISPRTLHRKLSRIPVPIVKINLERWTAENKNARIPAAHSTTNNTVVTDHFVQNTDYIKLRNVEIGYTLPKKFLSSLRISTARIYLNGQNLAVWDKMWLKDRDPESAGGAALAYPLQRVFNIGIHVEL